MAEGDVVRHVILRVLVDAENLAAEMAGVRAQLAALEGMTSKTARTNAEAHDNVTSALDRQRKLVEANAAADEKSGKSSAKTTQQKVLLLNQLSQAIAQNTKAQEKARQAEEETARTAEKNQGVLLQAEEKLRGARKANDDRHRAAMEDLDARMQKNAAARRRQGDEDTAKGLLNLQRIQDAEKAGDDKSRAREETRADARRRRQREEDIVAEVREKAAENAERRKDTAASLAAATRMSSAQRTEGRKDARAVEDRGARAEERAFQRVAKERKEAADQAIRDAKGEAAVRGTSAREEERTASQRTRNIIAESKLREKAAAEAVDYDQAVADAAEKRSAQVAKTKADADKAELRTLDTKRKGDDSYTSQVIQNAERVAQARLRTQEAERRAQLSRQRDRKRGPGFGGAIGEFVDVIQSTARGFAENFKEVDGGTERVGRFRNAIKETRAEVTRMRGDFNGASGALGTLTAAFHGFTSNFRAIDRDTDRVGRLRNALRGARSEVGKLSSSGDGGSIFGTIGQAVSDLADGVTKAFSGMAQHALSFRGLIILIIAGLGPLMAALGALGAVAIAAGNTLIGLAGSLMALPGLFLAAAAGAGALFAALSPVQKAFAAYEKASTAAGKSAKERAASEKKATEELKNAQRQLEDYRLELARLAHDQEGQELKKLDAEAALRRAMADPRSSNLDRRKAKFNVDETFYDRQKFDLDKKRLVEDAAKAETDVGEKKAEKAAGGSEAKKAKDELEEALGKLGPNTRKFVETIYGLKTQWERIQKNVGEALFKPIVEQLGPLTKLLTPLEDILTKAAGALGKVGAGFIQLFSSDKWTKFFDDLGGQNATILEDFGFAAIDVADGLRAVMEVVNDSGFMTFITKGVKGLAADFREWANSADGKSGIIDFLTIAKKRMDEVGTIVGNLFTVFKNLFFGSDDFTTDFMGSLTRITDKWAEWSKEAADPNSGFQKWLRDVKPLVHDVGVFVGKLVTSIAEMASDPENIREAQHIFQTLSEDVLPKLVSIFHELSESEAFSKLVDGIASLLGAVDKFLKGGGTDAIGFFADFLAKAGEAINWILDNVPGAATILGGLAVALAVLAGASIFAKFTGLIKLGELLRFITGSLKGTGSFKAGIANLFDSVKDKLFGREKGESANTRANRSGTTPAGGRPGTGGVLPHLTRMEGLLRDIERAIKKCCSGGGGDGDGKRRRGGRNDPDGGGGGDYEGRRRRPDDEDDDPRRSRSSRNRGDGRRPRRGRGQHRAGRRSSRTSAFETGADLLGDVVDFGPEDFLDFDGGNGDRDPRRSKREQRRLDREGRQPGRTATPRARPRGGRFGRVARGTGKAGAVIAIGSLLGGIGLDLFDPTAAQAATAGGGAAAAAPGIGSQIMDMFGGATGVATTAAMVGLPALGRVASRSALPLVARLGGAAAGLANPLTTVGTAVGLVGDLAFKDRKSTGAQGTRLAGAVLTGAGIGATIGSIIPGVGTVVGGAIGGLAGGAYSLYKDPALRKKVGRGVSAAGKGLANTWDTVSEGFMENVGGPVADFFTKTLPGTVSKFFTETIPNLLSGAWKWLDENLQQPFKKFWTESVPDFFTETIPNWFTSMDQAIEDNIRAPIKSFFIERVPKFFTEDLPNALGNVGQLVMDKIVNPITNFFHGLPDQLDKGWNAVTTWATGLFGGKPKAQSGAIVPGTYTGQTDTIPYWLTIGEGVVRRSAMEKPLGKQLWTDWNEGHIDPAQFYAGLDHATRSVVAPTIVLPKNTLAGQVAGVSTVTHAGMSYGDVIINNPVREKAPTSMRRHLQAMAHLHGKRG